jgi:lipopolysaccharide transport system permease protein
MASRPLSATQPGVPVHVLRPSSGWAHLELGELWRYRELLLVFTWRNILVRYKQTLLGILWAILQPFFLMVVFTIFLNRLAGVEAPGGLSYPVFVYAGLLPWTLFSNSLTQSSVSLVSNSNLLRKIYFPRLIIPISVVLTALVDFLVASSLLFVLMVVYGDYPEPWRLLALPGLVLLALATALGVGLWLSALNVEYRDIQFVVPFLSQVWLFLTPAVYATATFSEPWNTLLGLNPMQGVVAGFRWCLLGAGDGPGWMLAVSAAVTCVVLVTGAFYFRRLERSFADVV